MKKRIHIETDDCAACGNGLVLLTDADQSNLGDAPWRAWDGDVVECASEECNYTTWISADDDGAEVYWNDSYCEDCGVSEENTLKCDGMNFCQSCWEKAMPDYNKLNFDLDLSFELMDDSNIQLRCTDAIMDFQLLKHSQKLVITGSFGTAVYRRRNISWSDIKSFSEAPFSYFVEKCAASPCGSSWNLGDKKNYVHSYAWAQYLALKKLAEYLSSEEASGLIEILEQKPKVVAVVGAGGSDSLMLDMMTMRRERQMQMQQLIRVVNEDFQVEKLVEESVPKDGGKKRKRRPFGRRGKFVNHYS